MPESSVDTPDQGPAAGCAGASNLAATGSDSCSWTATSLRSRSPRTLSRHKAAFMADAQVPWGLEALSGAVGEPAWRTKPSWYLVATEDRHDSPPPAQQAMAQRAGSTKVEQAGSRFGLYFASGRGRCAHPTSGTEVGRVCSEGNGANSLEAALRAPQANSLLGCASWLGFTPGAGGRSAACASRRGRRPPCCSAPPTCRC